MRHPWNDRLVESCACLTPQPPSRPEGKGEIEAARKPRARFLGALLGVALCAILLAACGGTAQGQRQQARGSATPAATPSAAPSPTLAPTPSPTAATKPNPTPTAIPQPPAPPLAPPILDVRPSSMSIVGHLDCAKTTVYVCQAAVIAEASNQRSLRWTASTSLPGGHIGFSPASGVLAPGQSVLVTITVPFGECAPGLFIFQGPANTHTISWAC